MRIQHISFRRRIRNLCAWSCLVIGSGCFAVVIQRCGKNSEAQETHPWMISGAVARGLFEGRGQSASSEQTPSWMAEVQETDWQYIVIHHSATQSGSVESIHQQHLKRRDAAGSPWLGIGYHFLIGNGQGMPDGAVQATFRWKNQLHGAHSGDELFNNRGIGICVVGNFENSAPSRAQLASLKSLVKVLAIRHRITPENLMGHGSIRATACPGKHFPLNEIRQVVSETKS